MEQRGKTAKAVAKRDKKGQFVKGTSGNPHGRPVGSKNRVNILKISLEEGFREHNWEQIAQILNGVVEDALDGDKVARKMVWDACISKANLSEDKDSKGNAPEIVIRHMEVQKQGDIIDVEPIEEENHE